MRKIQNNNKILPTAGPSRYNRIGNLVGLPLDKTRRAGDSSGLSTRYNQPLAGTLHQFKLMEYASRASTSKFHSGDRMGISNREQAEVARFYA